jgi:hypothetical protein
MNDMIVRIVTLGEVPGTSVGSMHGQISQMSSLPCIHFLDIDPK